MAPSFLQTPFGAAREIPIPLFLAKILPPLHSKVNLKSVTKAASRKSKRNFNPPVNKNGRLWGYKDQKPSDIEGPNGLTYRSLQTSAVRLSKALEGLFPSFEFRNNDAVLWDLEDRQDDSLPDAYLLAKSSAAAGVDWASIAVSGVYRKSSSKGDAEVNITKITRCMSQCIHQDPRRRYTYGFSVEDDNMRLWYCDRAQIVASEVFDFTQDVVTLFHFLFSVMFAEHHALGFDPTMTRRQEDDGSVRYDIVVRSESGEEHVYRTLKLLSAPDKDRLVGRGTHVWKAVQVVDGHETGEPVALKDAWVDHHREREGSIYHRICASASSASETKVIKSTFLTVICHGDTFVAGLVDRTRSLPEETSLPFILPSGALQSSDVHQIHYRVVYKEVCEPLRDITSLAIIFRTLREVIFGLATLYWCGWVHGDISIGNILLFDDHAKIADLEYTVQMSERQRHDCIGTPYFIPNEVKQRSYLFQTEPVPQTPSASSDSQPPVVPPDPSANGNDSDKPASETSAISEQFQAPVFLYNPIHDLESLWWLAVYFIVCMEVVNSDGEDETQEQATRRKKIQRKMATELFWSADSRLMNFTHPTCFLMHAQQLHPAVRNIALQLDSVRSKMIMTYRKAEIDVYNIQDKVAGEMHIAFSRSLGAIITALNKGDVTVRPFVCE